jgi:hypothetical protein
MVSQLLLRQQATKVAQLGERDPYSTVAENNGIFSSKIFFYITCISGNRAATIVLCGSN